MTNATPGRLYVVATPIGNLGDLSARACDTLRTSSLIAAEDTRHTGVLLKHFGIQTPMVSLHEHNELERTPELVARMRSGATIALVSDAGAWIARARCGPSATGAGVVYTGSGAGTWSYGPT